MKNRSKECINEAVCEFGEICYAMVRSNIQILRTNYTVSMHSACSVLGVL